MKVVVIGAGLSGLTAAVVLADAGCEVVVLEAREEPGGRIRSVRAADGRYLADLGPTWVWPAHQPIAHHWMKELGVAGFDQFEDGLSVVEQGGGPPQRMRLPAQEGNVRPVGGPQALIDALVARLPTGSIVSGQKVSAIDVNGAGVVVTTTNGGKWHADSAVVAVPPRIADETIHWSPQLPADLAAALQSTPTWMAPHAKAVALYERPFWREQGASGRIHSSVGPLVEVHDHCGAVGEPAALFGFVGVPAAERGPSLEAAIVQQLARCFGAGSPLPSAVYVEDWARDPLVSTLADLAGPGGHPSVRPDCLRAAHFEGRLVFAGAETARVSPGLIEGAFAAGVHAARLTLRG